jgi:hypothetical protein
MPARNRIVEKLRVLKVFPFVLDQCSVIRFSRQAIKALLLFFR